MAKLKLLTPEDNGRDYLIDPLVDTVLSACGTKLSNYEMPSRHAMRVAVMKIVLAAQQWPEEEVAAFVYDERLLFNAGYAAWNQADLDRRFAENLRLAVAGNREAAELAEMLA